MSNCEKITWLNEAEENRFAAIGLTAFADFWNFDESNGVETELCREHADRISGDIVRRTVRLTVDGADYFLKRTQGRYFQCVVNEFEAGRKLPDFNLHSADVAAYCLDHKQRLGFVLLKNLDGFISFKELCAGKADESKVKLLESNKQHLLEHLIKTFLTVRKASFFYPDWRDKHLFFDLNHNKIALIDLERFVHTSQLPWYYRIGPLAASKRKKELRTFINSLQSNFFSEQAILDTFDKLEPLV